MHSSDSGRILADDSEAVAKRKRTWILVVVLLGGLSLLHAGSSWEMNVERNATVSGRPVAQEGWWSTTAPKLCVDLGMAFVIAATVSFVFDRGFHDEAFGRPVRQLLERVTVDLRAQVEKGRSLNVLLDAATALHVTSLSERHTDAGQQEWQSAVLRVVARADDYILLCGRTLQELFPDSDRHVASARLIEVLRAKLRASPSLQVKIVLADAYTPNSAFRTECASRRSPDSLSAAGLWEPARATAHQILRLRHELASERNFGGSRLLLRLSDERLPFCAVITEASALVQHYLPRRNGRFGLVMGVERSGDDQHDLYATYRRAFLDTFDHAQRVRDVIDAYILRKAEEDQEVADYLELVYDEPVSLASGSSSSRRASGGGREPG